jgi:hypothetical protein
MEWNHSIACTCPSAAYQWLFWPKSKALKFTAHNRHHQLQLSMHKCTCIF